MMKLATGAAALALAAGTVLAASAPSFADPKGDPINLSCSDGTSFQVVSPPPDAKWTPAMALDSQKVFIPTAFGPSSFMVTQVSTGDVIASGTDPGYVKGNATKTRKTSVECTYSGSGTYDDPDLGLVAFEFSGSVTAFTTPAH